MDSFFGMELPVPPMPMSGRADEADERNEFGYTVEACAEQAPTAQKSLPKGNAAELARTIAPYGGEGLISSSRCEPLYAPVSPSKRRSSARMSSPSMARSGGRYYLKQAAQGMSLDHASE
ncbi:hypothetical protein D3C86_1664790 [compost metagenome]